MQRWGICAVLLVGCGSSGNNTATCPPNAICVDAQPGTGDAPHAIDAPNNVLIDSMIMADVPGGVGEPPDLMGMTLYHNQVRAAVDTTGIAAGPLPSLQWDPNLASYAATWAAMCQDTTPADGLVDHNPNRTNVAGYAYIGENIFAAGGQTATAMQAVNGWADEKADYTYATNTCAAGRVCGHYTQLVWRATLYVGCALQNCPNLMYPSSIVCDYGPGGNYNGESPY